jgi:ArsR family transcriptional regulator, arsenate/arsenite/antimonite-responsive transcriptional repressor
MTDRKFFGIAKALADPQRFRIFSRIASATGEVPCKALVEECGVSAATISHHLKELANAELIESRREGQCAHLSVRRSTIEAYRAELQRRVTAPGS